MNRSLFTILLLLFQPGWVNASETGTEIGKHAPQFELRDLAGKIVAPLQKPGKSILLTFWSTLCSPCVAEMPAFEKLHSSLKENDFEVIAIAIDSSDKPVRQFLSRNSVSFTVLLDPEKEVFFDLYAGPTLPAGYLIDRNGIIVEKFSGTREWDSKEMKKRIETLLQKR